MTSSCLPRSVVARLCLSGYSIGYAPLAQLHGVRVVELTALDEIAIANSIPTAEGAVQLAMEKLPITIHGADALVLGSAVAA